MLNAEQMRMKTQRRRNRRVKNAIRKIYDNIKEEARGGYHTVTVSIWHAFSDDEKQMISNHFTSKGYRFDWDLSSYVYVKWGLKNEQ